MATHEEYWGRNFEVVSQRQVDGSWRAVARILEGAETQAAGSQISESQGSSTEMKTESFATEEEARSAARALATGEIDRLRVGAGKR